VTSLAAEYQKTEVSLWRAVLKLLRLRGLILINGFRRAKLRGKIGTIILIILVVGGLAFGFWLSWLMLRAVSSPQLASILGDTSRLLASVPILVVTAAFIGILLTSFGVLLQALYLSGDMEFLLSLPVPIRAVFITKMLQAILPNFGLILLFGLPVLYGLGIAQGYNLLYYPLVLVILALLALAAAGLASLLVMAVVRIFPARRVAEVLGFLVAIISFLCSQSGQLANYTDISGEQAFQVFNILNRVNTPWSPLAWAGFSLVNIGEANWLAGMGLLLLTILLTGGLFAVSLLAAERLYYSGWASVQVSARSKKPARSTRRRREAAARASSPFQRLLPSAVRGIVTKDFMMLRRDLRSMSQLVTPLILGILYGFMLIRSGGQAPAGRGEAPEAFMEVLGNLMVYANVGIALFVGWSLLSRLAAMGFSQEGKSYWLLKAAPVSTSQLLGAKFLVAYLPTLGLCMIFLLVLSLVRQVNPLTVAYSMLAVLLILAGATGLNLTWGVIGANFNWEDPRRISQGSSGCLGAITSMVFFLVSMGLFFGPLALAGIFSLPEAAGQAVGLALGSATSLAAAIIPLWLVRRRVNRLMEN